MLCQHLNGLSMGTTWSVQVAAPLPATDAQALQLALQAGLDDIVDQMSHWEPDSLLSRLNRAPTGWYQVPPAFYQVISCALQVAALTDGAYDPTVGELVNLWGFGPRGRPGQPAVTPRDAPLVAPLPDADALQAARQRAGWQQLHLNEEHHGLWQPGGVTLDFSAIAKGYGVDVMAQVMHDHGIADFMVELGGELRVRGRRSPDEAWRLSVESPDGKPDSHLPITLNDLAIASSGDYRRYFFHEGRRYAHTVDPRTGQALQHDLACVSVIHPQCMMADALSTALLCMGPNDGPAFSRQHDIAALFMTRHGDDIAVEWSDAFYRLAHPGE